MTLVLALVKGEKNALGAFQKPDQIDKEAIIKGSEKDVVIPDVAPGDTVETGEYFLGKFNVEKDDFVSDLVAVEGFEQPGQAEVSNVHVEQDNGQPTVFAD